jgi:hypothetical protein
MIDHIKNVQIRMVKKENRYDAFSGECYNVYYLTLNITHYRYALSVRSFIEDSFRKHFPAWTIYPSIQSEYTYYKMLTNTPGIELWAWNSRGSNEFVIGTTDMPLLLNIIEKIL